MSTGPVAPEVLAFRRRRQWLPRWLSVVLVVAVVVAGAVAAVVNVDRRSSETDALQACAKAARQAAEGATAPVLSMMGYTRPTLSNKIPHSVRAGLLEMVSANALPDNEELAAARHRCEHIAVWRWHGDLRDRRAACVAGLASTVRYLADVAADAHVAFAGGPPSFSGC